MGNIELRWIVTDDVNNPQKVLQYRQMVDNTIRAAAAGMWNEQNLAATANYQWSKWIDVPTHVERDLQCP